MQLLSQQFPFVEWGLLLSQAKPGTPRYPSVQWMQEAAKIPIRFSGHICDKWMREVCKGKWGIFDELPFWPMFKRFQINFSHEVDRLDIGRFLIGLQEPGLQVKQQIILQVEDVNHPVVLAASKVTNVAPMYDVSSGHGILPQEWPQQVSMNRCGFAGGLSPDNVAGVLEKLESVAPDFAWIDVESKVRSEDDQKLDLDKVRQFLENVQPWVKA